MRREQPGHPPPDFQFPQMENPKLAAPGWHPELLDYIYVSFTNSIAFSPTDAMPLSRRAKLLMLVRVGDLGDHGAARRGARGQHLQIGACTSSPGHVSESRNPSGNGSSASM